MRPKELDTDALADSVNPDYPALFGTGSSEFGLFA